jgi:hypothetical protein
MEKRNQSGSSEIDHPSNKYYEIRSTFLCTDWPSDYLREPFLMLTIWFQWVMPGIESRTLHMLGKCFVTELYPQPLVFLFILQCFVFISQTSWSYFIFIFQKNLSYQFGRGFLLLFTVISMGVRGRRIRYVCFISHLELEVFISISKDFNIILIYV